MSSEKTFASVEDVANSKAGRITKGVIGGTGATVGALTGNPAMVMAGTVMATNLIGGSLKNWADKRKDKRESGKDEIKKEKEEMNSNL